MLTLSQPRLLPYLPLLLKTLVFCIMAILLRGTLPRYRFDHLIQLTWKHFIFFWLAFLLLNLVGLVYFFTF